MDMLNNNKRTETPKDLAAPAGTTVAPASIVATMPPSSTEVPAKKVEAPTLPVATEVEDNPKQAQLRPQMRPHAFVIMPFGKKKGGDGSIYDFNAIYTQLIKPTLEMAGFEPFRADEETTSGDILTDMFQELLLADLCLVDMSIDNANVFYELGIRHAFRKRGIIHIQAGRAYMPFDIFNVRTIPYHINADGAPDISFIEKDKAAIAQVTRDTWASDIEAIHSPVFNILTGLVEPERKTLRTPLATGFWREYNEWKQRITIAQRQKRIGDILLLTEEIKNPLIKEEAINEAQKALTSMKRYELALNQVRNGLEVNAKNLEFRRTEGILLNRMGRVDDAIVKLESLLMDVPTDSEALSALGRIYKDTWYNSWKGIKDKNLLMKAAFDSYHWLIKSFDVYLKAYRIDLNNFYPGINAFTLGTILVHLANKYDNKKEPDPEISWVRGILNEVRGSLFFSLGAKVQEEKADYWSLASLAELQVLTADVPQKVVRGYRKAMIAARRNESFLQSSLDQLNILQSLELRLDYVKAGMDAINDELKFIHKKENAETTEIRSKKAKKAVEEQHEERDGYVFLFTGYMINNASKKGNHFPPEKEHEIRGEIKKALEKYNAGPKDLAVTTGMDAGSELLFVEVCAEKGIPVRAYFPTVEAPYVRDFVSPGGEQWVERFYKMRNHHLVDEFYQPDQVGLPKKGDFVHERNNRWALYSALVRGIDKVRLIAVWNGKNETEDLDARLIKHMVDLMRDTGGMVEQINPHKSLQGEYIDGAFDGLPDLSKPRKNTGSKTIIKKRK